MLDALSDFWKPMKKNQQVERLQPDQLQVGSVIGFGFVPQPSLNGRRLSITHINTYQFGDEALTSFVLSQDQDAGVSMIVAESEGEQYLAISRRIPAGDRMKMFDAKDLDLVMTSPDQASLNCRELMSDFKGWLVTKYKREISGLTGFIYRGDFRKAMLPEKNQAQQFSYTLLVSDNNEHAIEIEKYSDGRIEMYATIYRRTTDIGEITNPARAELGRPDLKLASVITEAKPVEAESKPKAIAEVQIKQEQEPATQPAKPEPIRLQDFAKTNLPEPEEIPEKNQTLSQPTPKHEEKKPMANEQAVNGAADKSKFASPLSDVFPKSEAKPSNKLASGMDNEAIECDLRVANKIIEEAIRNEMRLSDVVRRIVELPVAHQEAVHIPVTLSDDDYALLAIRYGMQASDRNSIKRRILEDLNSFSGKKAA
ncbi:MAG: hypothetical protein LW823_08735 [Rickettsiales bacterium]|jgi:hypothetical protein|nr:hypothetical protein [Rickettsiales bacterium]